ncbi:MFS general substrate transporter [Clathrospora elynae]|uniref:MFS general substrate transporter n=1 Tax=Clathrospora elynae TaxID=706981 RepID=A0A6A5SYJ7_9PLEO|nr:MFS general substrate transporter [Clathrospora elynae]
MVTFLEKGVLPGTRSSVSVPDDGDVVDLEINTPARRERRKVDTTVLLLLFLGLLVFQLDCMNLASALTDGFAKEIKVFQNNTNLDSQLMFPCIVVLEIPSNIILQHIGPQKWTSAQVFIFGLVVTLQVFVKNNTGFLVSRSFLGLCKAGYIPGGIYTLSTWYTKRELAKRVAVFFFGMFGGNTISTLLTSGILKLRGHGIYTMCVAMALLLLLPGSPDQPLRLQADDSKRMPGTQGLRIPISLVWKTVKHYRRWTHFISTVAVFPTWSLLIIYMPIIMMTLGSNTIEANALASVGGFLALGVVFFFGWLSDKINKRGLSVIIAQSLYLIILIITHSVHPNFGKWSRWGFSTTVNAFAIGYHPVLNSWVQLNCMDPREKSISIAIWVMSAISGLMTETQYYRADDLPFYSKGLQI